MTSDITLYAKWTKNSENSEKTDSGKKYKNEWVDGKCYYFGGDGYLLTNQYVDGCWVGADGAWS